MSNTTEQGIIREWTRNPESDVQVLILTLSAFPDPVKDETNSLFWATKEA